MTESEASHFATQWIEAWNSHNLDRILEHYDEDIMLVSPVAARILNDPAGTVVGKTALRAYFARALELYPDLRFELLDFTWGLTALVLFYRNQKGVRTGEFMEIGATGKVHRVVATYAGLPS